MLEKYKTDYEEATDKIKESMSEAFDKSNIFYMK